MCLTKAQWQKRADDGNAHVRLLLGEDRGFGGVALDG